MINPACLGGFKIVIHPPHKSTSKRTWKERLFTFPWRPWRSTKDIYFEMIKDGEIIMSGDTLFMNEKTAMKLQEAFNKDRQGGAV